MLIEPYGFFSKKDLETSFRDLRKRRGCKGCSLSKGCLSPMMKPTGKGKKKILLIAEAPGKKEDHLGKQLVGKAGKTVRRALSACGIDLDRDCIKTNAVRCRPPKNRTPTDVEIDFCRTHIIELIKDFKPRVIILAGDSAIKSVIGQVWKEDLGGVNRWRGWTIPDRTFKCWICPTYHPSYVNRSWEKDKMVWKLFATDVRRAVEMLDVPFPKYANEEDQVNILLKDSDVISYLKDLLKREPPLISIDYETTGKKPHRKGHKVVSTSISENDESATAFLITPSVIPYLVKVLKNKNIGKIAGNIPFEEMWSEVCFKTRVRKWIFDVVASSHIKDNREKTCNVKFQGYVRYGICGYDDEVRHLLKSKNQKDGNAFNRIFEIPIKTLLRYNGVDTILEYRMAKDDMEVFL